MRKLKSKVEICKLSSTTLVFLPRYREACKLSPSPRWSPLQGIPRKGQAPGRVTPWIAQALPTRKWVSSVPSSKPLPDRSPPSSLSSFRLKHRRPCSLQYTVVANHKCGRYDLAKLQAPPMYNDGVRKHRVVRGMQTSLNTRPKPRASA